MKLKHFVSFLKASLVIGSLLFFGACGKWGYGNSSQQFQGATMGTRYHISINKAEDLDIAALQTKVDARLEHIEQSMSTYRKSSEISRFNQLPAGEQLAVSEDFYQVFLLAQKVYQQSQKSFDPSIGALVELWGFGWKVDVANFQKLPEPQLIEQAKAALSFGAVQVADAAKRILQKNKAGHLDFSAIAKGYAVDQIALLIKQQGVNNSMVEIGGEIATHGYSSRGGAWHIGIERPEQMQGKTWSTLKLGKAGDAAYIATSGDYRNYYEIDGKRYSHTIDPRSGYPVDHKLSSVTVIAGSTAEADAWATALMVLGEVEGLALAEKLGINALFIYRADKAFAMALTANMKAYL